MIHLFIQARMSSARFPGKVLAPLQGKPVIQHLLERVAKVEGVDEVILLTSDHTSDDPLAWYVEKLGAKVYRGELANVLARFQSCHRAHPSDWVVRLCGDSPWLNPEILRQTLCLANESVDIVTNTQPRTFPSGQSVEMIRSKCLQDLRPELLEAAEQEHVTQHFYLHPEKYRVLNLESEDERGDFKYAIDTIDDLRTMEENAEAMLSAQWRRFRTRPVKS